MNNVKDFSKAVNALFSHIYIDDKEIKLITSSKSTLTETNKTYGNGEFTIYRVNQELQNYIISKSKEGHDFKITLWADDPDSQPQCKTELYGVKFHDIELDGFKQPKSICEYRFPFTVANFKYI